MSKGERRSNKHVLIVVFEMNARTMYRREQYIILLSGSLTNLTVSRGKESDRNDVENRSK